MNTAHKLQRLNALRLQRDHLLEEIATLEADVASDLDGNSRLLRGKPRRLRNVEHVDTVTSVHTEQDLDSWRRRLASVEGL